jgi:HflK protein
VLGWLAGIGIGLYLLSGFTMVGPDEMAVVRRFGKPVDPDLGPGLHWRWPWPIDTVTRLKPDQVRTVEIGFRSLRKAEAVPQALTWASGHQGAGLVPQREEAVMITGDGNLVELQATVRYVIADPRTYLFEANRTDKEFQDLLRYATESVLREAISARPFFDLLTVSREELQKQVQQRLEARCQDYQLGIRIEGVSLSDLHPPPEVVEDYHRVAKAMEDRDRNVNEAQAEALKMRRSAEAQGLEMTRKAEEEAYRKVKDAEAARDGFLARLRARQELTADEDQQLRREVAAQFADPQQFYEEYQRRRQQRIALNAFLTDFRLTLETLTKVLGLRNKVIVDADNLPGKRHLMMVDPDWFRPPPPVFLPGDRLPERRPFEEKQ